MYEDLAARYGAQFNVRPDWILAVIQTESSGNPAALGDQGRSYGLMQVQLATARALGFRGEPEDLLLPDANVFFGTKVLADIVRRIGSADVRRVYSEYNSGRPDLYLTSWEVAAHVETFQENLSRVASGGAAPAQNKSLAPLALAGAAFVFTGGLH